MTTTTKALFAGVAVLSVMGALAFFGYSPFLKMVVQTFGNAPAGSSFTNAKFAGAVANLATPGANATSTSILNNDADDRYITGIRYACQGLGTSKVAYSGGGLAALTLSIATSSTAAPATNSNVNTVTAGTIGTSTAVLAVASTTAATPSTGVANTSFIWAAGSYLTFTTNATNTAVCTFGADYIAS